METSPTGLEGTRGNPGSAGYDPRQQKHMLGSLDEQVYTSPHPEIIESQNYSPPTTLWSRDPEPRQTAQCKLLASLHNQAADMYRWRLHAHEVVLNCQLLLTVTLGILLAIFTEMSVVAGIILAATAFFIHLCRAANSLQENQELAEKHRAMSQMLGYMHAVLTDHRMIESCTPGTLDLLSYRTNLNLTTQDPCIPKRILLPHLPQTPSVRPGDIASDEAAHHCFGGTGPTAQHFFSSSSNLGHSHPMHSLVDDINQDRILREMNNYHNGEQKSGKLDDLLPENSPQTLLDEYLQKLMGFSPSSPRPS